MSLQTAIRVTLGNWRYDTHAQGARVTLAALPGVNSARVSFPQAVEVRAAPGEDCLLELDGGEGLQTVLTGKLTAVAVGVAGTEVELGDAGARLAALRPVTTYEAMQAGDIVAALCDEAGVALERSDLLALALPVFAAHQGRTAAEHIALLCELAGGLAVVTAGGELAALVPSTPDTALLYGREFTRYTRTRLPQATRRQVLVGNGPAGSAQAPDALVHSRQALPGDAPAPGRDALWRPRSVLRTPDAALAAGAAADKRSAARAERWRAEAFLLPALRPGAVLQVQGLPERLASGSLTDGDNDGNWLITRVEHCLDAERGGRTRLSGVSAVAGDGALLGALVSAAGGLL